MRKGQVFILLLILSAALFGCDLFMGDGYIGTRVIDKITSEPLEGVVVHIGDQQLQTNDEGITKMVRREPGPLEILFEKDNYQSITEEVYSTGGKELYVEVEMERLAGQGTITGYVTDARGGPGIENALVRGEGIEASYTDENGYFKSQVWADHATSIFVEKEGRGTVKFQRVLVQEKDELEIEMPSRSRFKEEYSSDPLTITVDGIEPGDELSGGVQFSISAAGDTPLYALYGYYNGSTIRELNDLWLETDSGQAYFESIQYPNGEAVLSFYAYDLAGNLTIYQIPVHIQNDVVHKEKPGDLDFLVVYSMTWGQNPGFFKEDDRFSALELPNGEEFNLEAAPADSALYNVLEWEAVKYTVGYSIYRSFDGEKFTKIADVTGTIFFDTSPELAVGKKTYYQVLPYNSYGTGGTSPELFTTPLPAFNVYLQEPADGVNDVPIQPTFSWEHDGDFHEDVNLTYQIHLYVATFPAMWSAEIRNEESIQYPDTLDPRSTYTWDIYSSVAHVLYQNDSEGQAFASSFAGERDGSINGEFIFTTAEE